MNGPAARSDLDRLDETRREIKELAEAWSRRHGLRRGSPEYVAALEHEDRLVTRIWRRLRADGTTATRMPIKD